MTRWFTIHAAATRATVHLNQNDQVVHTETITGAASVVAATNLCQGWITGEVDFDPFPLPGPDDLPPRTQEKDS